MPTEYRAGIPGIVRNGVVVPQTDQKLPDGVHVEILLEPQLMPLQLREELAAWERASDEAWRVIDRLESEKP